MANSSLQRIELPSWLTWAKRTRTAEGEVEEEFEHSNIRTFIHSQPAFLSLR